jgi:hypothetical protein
MAISLSVSRKKDRILQFRLALFSGRRSRRTPVFGTIRMNEKIQPFAIRNFSRLIGRLGVFTAIPVKRMISPLVQMLVKISSN